MAHNPDTPALAALREAQQDAHEDVKQAILDYGTACAGFLSSELDRHNAKCDAMHRLAAYRDAVAARVRAEQAEVLTFIRRNLYRFFGHREHWDPTMRSGQGCPLCIEQNHARAEIEERIRAALPPEGDHAG